MNLNDMLFSIKPVDCQVIKACKARFDQVAKPIAGLGRLETLVAQIAGITGLMDVDINKKAVVVFCADNGVVRQNVSQYGAEVTTSIAKMLGVGKASVSVMANLCAADVFPVDIGMMDTVDGLRNNKLMNGTDDITKGPAMSRDTAEKAIMIGIEMVGELKANGYRLIASGEAGIGNTTSSSAVCSVLVNRPVREVTGRGAGLSDSGLCHKQAVIEQAIAVNQPDPMDPLDVLHKLGGLDIAALTGLFLGGARYHVPIVMDGFISNVAALLAVQLCSDVKDYILPSHESAEPGSHFLLDKLGFFPVIKADMHLGEGTGAVALFPLLDMALAVYNDAATFADIQVEQYERPV